MHQQSIIDGILQKLDTRNCRVQSISLMVDEDTLRQRLKKDVQQGIRTADVIDRSLPRIPMYRQLDTIKIDTVGKTVQMVADEIMKLK